MADWTPQSRAEEILFKTINGEPYDGLPQSRIEELLLELKDAIESGGGGGGGTDNYNLLKNLPQINGQTIKGNMSGTTLGLVNMVMGKDLSTNDYTNADKAIVDSVTADLADKVDKVIGKGLSENDYTDADKAIVGGFTSALAGKVDKVTGKGLSTNDYDNTAKGIVDGVTSALAGKVSTSSVGSANGVAELDANGRVPSSQLPSYVDDTVEGYLNSVDGKFYADSSYTTEITGETGKIYVTLDTNKTYRWSGSGFVEISESLALGETSSTAYAGNKGKANADAIAGIKNGTSINSFSAVETALAGKANSSDLGDKSNLTTTDRSSAVGAINEVNSFFVNIGAITANDWTNFFKNACAAFHALNPKTYVVHNVFLSWGGTRYCGLFIDYGDAIDFTITGGGGSPLYCGYSMLSGAGETRFHKYNDDTISTGSVDIVSTYFVNSWTIYRNGNMRILKTNDIKDLPSGGNLVIGTLPVGDRPQGDFYHSVYGNKTGAWYKLNLHSNGDLTIDVPTAVSQEWINMNIVYAV